MQRRRVNLSIQQCTQPSPRGDQLSLLGRQNIDSARYIS